MSEVTILVLNPIFFENYHLQGLWEISANVNNYFGLFTIHFFTKSRLATIDENEQFSRPVPQTLKGPANTRSRISRCTVCLRKPPDRIIPFVL